MPREKICKTVHQFNREPLLDDTMEKLLEIAADCCKVKNYVYARYGGIGSLAKLYPGYTIQNEMTASGLRESLGLPSVYFYLAVFDALGDIKGQWSRVKAKVGELVGKNERFTQEEKHYLRFVLKISNAFTAVLNQEPIVLKKAVQVQYEELADAVDVLKLHYYLCRKVRKYLVKLHTDAADGFSVSEKAYRYKDHGIYLATKENRKRVFIPLTDNNHYAAQLYVKLDPEHHGAAIHAPVRVAVRRHEDYVHHVGVAMGMSVMLTTDEGRQYGRDFGKYQMEYAEWIRSEMSRWQRNRENNPGRKKYYARKGRYEEQLHSYINCELNRFLREEKPEAVYIPKLPREHTDGVNKKINHSSALWQRGYIRKRLEQKCREHSVELREVFAKGISLECSCCGAEGKKEQGRFYCPSCGFCVEDKVNTACNVKRRGMKGFSADKGRMGEQKDRAKGLEVQS